MMTTEVNDYFLQIAQGKIADSSVVNKFGRNETVNDEEIIWDGGATEYVFQTSAVTMEMLSSSTNDTNGGTGAWKVRVYGLDNDFESITEEVTLNGTTPVTLVNQYIRMFRMIVLESGTPNELDGANVGTLTCRVTATEAPQAMILPGNGQTLMALYTIPAGYTGYLWSEATSGGKLKEVLFKLKQRAINGVNQPFATKSVRDTYQIAFYKPKKIPVSFPEKSDVLFTGENINAGNVECSASFTLQLVKN